MKSNKLANYLAVTAGFGCTAATSEGAIVAYSFAPGTIRASSDSPNIPAGINMTYSVGYPSDGSKRSASLDSSGSLDSVFASSNNISFTSGSDLDSSNSGFAQNASYLIAGSSFGGATLDGNKNYTNISFNGNDTIYEAVGEFIFDGMGGGSLTGLAIDNTGSALSISNGKAAIEAVPEPSALSLLALGSAGLLLRRNRKQGA